MTMTHEKNKKENSRCHSPHKTKKMEAKPWLQTRLLWKVEGDEQRRDEGRKVIHWGPGRRRESEGMETGSSKGGGRGGKVVKGDRIRVWKGWDGEILSEVSQNHNDPKESTLMRGMLRSWKSSVAKRFRQKRQLKIEDLNHSWGIQRFKQLITANTNALFPLHLAHI